MIRYRGCRGRESKRRHRREWQRRRREAHRRTNPGAATKEGRAAWNSSTTGGVAEALRDMGADLTYENERIEGGEPMANLRARFSPDMKGIEVPPERAASMIDEYPVLSVVASFAQGQTVMRGVKELRVKESDRIDAMATGLRANGMSVKDGEDWWIVNGCGISDVPGGGLCETHLDHRIAMSFMILGMGSNKPVRIDDGGPIVTSFPIFEDLMAQLGASITRDDR